MRKTSTKQMISFIFEVLKSYYTGIGVMIFTAIGWSICLNLRPYLVKVIIDKIPTFPKEALLSNLSIEILAFIFLIFIYQSIFRIYEYFVNIRMIPNLRKTIAEYANKLLLRQSHSFYQDIMAGSLASRVNDLTSSIPSIVQIVLDHLLSRILGLTCVVFTLWQANYRFGIIMIVWCGGFILCSYLLSKKLTILSKDWSEKSSIITGKIVDVFSNILSVRLFARNESEEQALSNVFLDATKAEQKLQFLYFYLWLIYGGSFVIVQALSIYFLVLGYSQNYLTLGDFTMVLWLNTAVIDILWQFAFDFSELSKQEGKIRQALEVILIQPKIKDKANARELKIDKGIIEFKNIKFNYEGYGSLFEDKSIVIKSGEKVGLVGYSGSGKTSFVNLILRLYDINEGEILIDKQNITQVTQNSLHEAIAMIPQDPTLFHRSIMDNIRYGKINASDEEVIEAAKKAHAHEFIISLKEGYDSLVGERGVKLSGGQRQRIAIARAILKNAPILILDEATSQLDSLTEQYIQNSMWGLMEGKTTLVIAHRLSTLTRMDRIIVFDKGKIVEDGTHEQLLSNKKGLYKTLWDTQVGGFLADE